MNRDSIGFAQQGLLYNPRCGLFVTLWLKSRDEHVRAEFLETARELNRKANAMAEKTRVVVGASARLWEEWFVQTPPGGPGDDTILNRSSVFRDTGGDLWLFLKSSSLDNCRELLSLIRQGLGSSVEKSEETEAQQEVDGKILGDHFYDGLTNPADPAGLSEYIIRTSDDAYAGSCWAFIQKFVIDWDPYVALSPDGQDDVIGRTGKGAIIPDGDIRSHIQRARVFDDSRGSLDLLRLSLPFGRSASGAGHEKGIYFTGFARETHVLEQSLRNLSGDPSSQVSAGITPAKDKLLSIVQGISGGYWYIPSARQLGLAAGLDAKEFVLDAHWDIRSKNGLMFYNSPDYLHVMSTGRYLQGDAPSSRILSLIGKIFSRWQDNWYQVRVSPRIRHLEHFLSESEKEIMQASVAIRKGMAIKKSLTVVLTNDRYPQTPETYAWQADLFRIDPADILVGIMPELTLGRGKEVMPYLREEERIPAFLLSLDESSAMGHVVPNHKLTLEKGIDRLLEEVAQKRDGAKESAEKDFYQSVLYALEGVKGYCLNYATLAERMAADSVFEPGERDNLKQLAARMQKLARQAPTTFVEAVQMIFIMHCCLHLTGDPVSIGRLDQLLLPFFEADSISEEEAQEVIDALWIKLGEKAIHNRHNIVDTVSYGTTAVSYAGGNFPQGGGINQWVQQVTVGGYLPNDAAEPEPGANRITLLCLRASRRLPLNAPVLSLRVYPGMPGEMIEEAARALLSGGAHPILFQEDRMVRGLHEFSRFPLARARDYACDGCYEPMIAGASEFAFSNVAPLDALEATLNQGAKWNMAGPIYLRGWKISFRSPAASEITSFEMLQKIYLEHLEWLIAQFFNLTLINYGNLNRVCPDPLLSAMIEGCLESGRDLTNGGTLFHIVAPMFVGLATTIDSLHAIKKLVFDEETAVTTLPELLNCLCNDWGYNMQEPFMSTLAGPLRAAEQAARYQELRLKALALPRFGTGDPEVDSIGRWLMDNVCHISRRVFDDPPDGLKQTIDNIVQNYSLPGRPFKFHLEIGAGTFEGYVGDGANSGASADGRRNAQPYPSDLSPAPVPQDLPPISQDPTAPSAVPGVYREIYKAMTSWNEEAINYKVSNGAPVDLNVREDMPMDALVEFIERYGRQEVGTNLITITCVDPETYRMARSDPERFELVRVRMGGWTEYFSAMFPEHQKQHQRRPFFVSAPRQAARPC
jgi:Dyp-type peroxidase family